MLTACRQGLINIPLLYLMDGTFGMHDMIWTQMVTELLMLPVSLEMYAATFRHLPSPLQNPPQHGMMQETGKEADHV